MIPILSALMPLVGEVIDRIVPDKVGNEKAKREIESKIATAALKGQLGQLEINKIEAAHRSIWVAGWRPCCGWISAVALGFHFIVTPTVNWYGMLTGLHYPMPEFDMDSLLFILGSLLGISGLRTFEKLKGITK